jgi:hypothetical protein
VAVLQIKAARLGSCLVVAFLLWWDLVMVRMTNTASNKVFLGIFSACVDFLCFGPFSGWPWWQGEEEKRSLFCASEDCGCCLPSLTGHGGEERRRASSCYSSPARKQNLGVDVVLLCHSLFPPLDGHGVKGRWTGGVVFVQESRRHRDLEKLVLRKLPSNGEVRCRYHCPRGRFGPREPLLQRVISSSKPSSQHVGSSISPQQPTLMVTQVA